MAGGGTTVALALAAAAAGALPFLAAGYKTPEALSAEIRELRAGVDAFGVNVFVPAGEPVAAERYERYAAMIQAEADDYGLSVPQQPISDDDHWQEKLALLLADPVAAVSFTFGLPPEQVVSQLRAAGSTVFATVTSGDEALSAAATGVDGLIVQGPRAGGHSGTYDPRRGIRDRRTADVVAEVRAVTRMPVIAGGGIDGPHAVSELIAAGAEAVTVGTLLLRTNESGASQTHRDALASPAFSETVITRAFTGRPARGLLNGFIRRHEAQAPFGYPAIHHLTRDLRRAAAAAGDADRVHLWAGTGFRAATTGPAGDVIRALASEL